MVVGVDGGDLSAALDNDIKGLTSWLSATSSSNSSTSSNIMSMVSNDAGLRLCASRRDVVQLRIDGVLWTCPRLVLAVGRMDENAMRQGGDGDADAMRNGCSGIQPTLWGCGLLELEFLYLPLLEEDIEGDRPECVERRGHAVRDDIERAAESLPQHPPSAQRKRDREDEGPHLVGGGSSPHSTAQHNAAPPSRRERAAALSSPASLRALQSPGISVGAAAMTGLDPIQLPPPTSSDCCPTRSLSNSSTAATNPDDNHRHSSGDATTRRHASAVTPVIRLRVLSPVFHPFVDASTCIFQQELALRLWEQREKNEPPSSNGASGSVAGTAPPSIALRSAARWSDPTANAVGLLQLLLWVLSIPKASTGAVLEVRDLFPDDEEDDAGLIDAWALHRGGRCSDSMMAAALPVSMEVFEKGDVGDQRRWLNTLKENLTTLRRHECDALARQLDARQLAVAAAIGSYQAHQLFREPTFFLPHSCAESGSAVVWSLLDPALVQFLTRFGFMGADRGHKDGDDGKTSLLETAAVVGGADGAQTRSAFLSLCREDTVGVYSFALFTPGACAALAQETRNFESYDAALLPRFRPNSMNRYGLIVNEIGLKPLMTRLCRDILFPLANLLLPEHTCEHTLDDHHSFAVEYRGDADVFLDMHSDDSEVTFNVNLLDGFKGSSLCFCGMPGTEDHRRHLRSYEHALGRAVVHAGAQRHGALPITSGERMNLIVWGRSSWHRQQHGGRAQHPRHPNEMPPDAVCLSLTHDPDYHLYHPTE